MWKVGQETGVEAQGRRNVFFIGRPKNLKSGNSQPKVAKKVVENAKK